MTGITWSETGKLIVAALERSESDRDSFVRDHCADPTLSENIRLLLTPVPSGPAEVVAPDIVAPPPVEPGDHVGPYRVVEHLGRGGMGEVFLARDSRLDRPVALKCLFASSAVESDVRASVIREARAAARVTHPNVAAIHDVVEHEGRAFIVMEYVKGENLGALIRRGPLPPIRVVEIARQLAAALAAAHERGIIHRDLKPANVQVATDGSVKILDFGIATAVASLATGTTHTAFDVVGDPAKGQPGTPPYMSPEQLLGRTADERSDLFSLAVIMFEMATGRRPVASNRPLDLLLAAIGTLPRADRLQHDVPAALADVIEKGLAADPNDRYQSAAEVLTALDAVHEQLETGEAGVRSKAAPSLKRRVLWGCALVASLPLVFWALGRVMSEAYNITLERTGAFAWDPVQVHMDLGRRSIVAPIVYATLATASLWLARFSLRVIELSDHAHRKFRGAAIRLRTISHRLALDEPVVLAQGLSTLGLLALALVFWRFHALVRAWSSPVSTARPGDLWPLSPDNESEKVLYRAVLTVLLLIFTAGLVRVVHLRQRLRTRGGLGIVTVLTAIVACLFALNEVPYRLMWKSKAPRVVYQGQRCYAIGQAERRQLLYCPDNPPPRNREVDAGDPALQPTGVVEEIFTPPGSAR
jgi:serine/threonine protein kinase